MLTFGVLGSGYIFQKHKQAIERIGGKIVNIYDPVLSNLQKPEDLFLYEFDWLVICSPSFTHYNYLKMGLKYNKNIICEKPAWLPWQQPIDDDRINIVLQYRWYNPEESYDKVDIVVKRDENYFKSWKGNPMLTGGIFYNIFIHYIDLAIRFQCPFSGKIITDGEQYRKLGSIDLMSVDSDLLYTKMYEDVIFNDKGIKPNDIFYLNWILERCNMKFGMGKEILNKKIEFDPLNWEYI